MLRGYLNLALYVLVVMILLLPTIIYPGARGIRIVLIVCGLSGIGLVVAKRISRRR